MDFILDDTQEQEQPQKQFGSADYNFDFLDSYIDSVLRPTRTNVNQPADSDSFYDVDEDEIDGIEPAQEKVEEVKTELEPDQDAFYEPEEEEGFFDPMDQLFNADIIGSGEEKGGLRDQISAVESGGKYTATNPNSSATGKYQFLWSQWGDSIQKVTGVKSQKEFLNNPKAQEQYYTFYEKNVLQPEIAKIKQTVRPNLTDNQIGKLIHFRGAKGARDYLAGQLPDKPENYNMSISKYIGTKQAGGAVAQTPEEQFVGLNDSSLDQLLMPMQGMNVVRGLDNGQPVQVTDENGETTILYGPQDTVRTYGTVKEKRLK